MGTAATSAAASAGLLGSGVRTAPLQRALLGMAPAAPLAAAATGLVQLPHGPVVRDPYASAAGFPWWRGQLHTHTARSFDGDPTVPPQRRAEQYRAARYDFTVLTDHDRVSGVAGADDHAGGAATGAGPGRRPFLTLPGVESTDPGAHLGVWLLGDVTRADALDPALLRPDRPAVERMESWAAAGALVCCNHPNHPSARLTPDQVESWAGGGAPFRFMEVFNTLATTSAGAVAYNAEAWRRAVTAARPDHPVWGVATDDSHGQVVGRGWIAVAAVSLSPAALREALLAGRFYSSSGLAFGALGADPEAGGIKVAAPGATAIRFIGDDGRIVQQVAGETSVYRPRGDLRWVRVEASDAAGRTAWSQPFWLDA
jgi:predicted metal-dependent phosphoesterase TrpH